MAAAASALAWLLSAALPWPARTFTAFLLVPLPALLMLQARLLASLAAQSAPALEELRRVPMYASSAAALWVLAALAFAAARASGISLFALGLALPVRWLPQLGWAAALTVAATLLMLFAHALGVRESPMLRHLLPRSGRERVAFAALSISAGFCEELVFRGFLLTALYAASGNLVLAVALSAMAFGVVHAYQEPSGVARASVLGILLAVPFVLTGSLAASMLAHTLIDFIGGFWLGARLTR